MKLESALVPLEHLMCCEFPRNSDLSQRVKALIAFACGSFEKAQLESS